MGTLLHNTTAFQHEDDVRVNDTEKEEKEKKRKREREKERKREWKGLQK
jgi:hypothetical protein